MKQYLIAFGWALLVSVGIQLIGFLISVIPPTMVAHFAGWCACLVWMSFSTERERI